MDYLLFLKQTPGTGNVGIGTTSPSTKLQVDSSTAFSLTNGSGDTLLLTNDSTVSAIGAIGPSIGFGNMNNNNRTSAIAAVRTGGDHDNMGLAFFTHPSDSGDETVVQKMTITHEGNVGIGTTSPGQKLDVNGNANIDGTLFVNTTNNHIRLVDTDNTGNFSVGVNTNFQIRDITANTTPLTIRAGTPGNTILTTSTGRVGIGLTNPTVTLHVGGFARLNGGLQMNATNATIYQILDSDLRFGTNNTERMRIDNTGNVGIGTTTPGDKLHVNGTIRVQAPATSDWALLGYNSLGNAPSGLWFDNGDGELLLRDDSGNLNVRLRSDTSSYINGGNLGLGTTSPSQKLTVNSGRVLISNTSTPIYIKAGSTYKSWVHHIGGGDEYIFAPSTADNGETWDWSNQTRFDTSGVVQANNFVLASDKRLKTNIKNVSGKRIKANWKTFEMIADKTKAQRHGVIAQELEEVHPEFVRTNSEGIKSVAYTDLLIAKIAELEARLEKLEK